VRCGRSATVTNIRRPRDFGFGRAELGALLALFRGSLGLSARCFLGAQDRHTRGLRPFGLGSRRLLLRGNFGRSLGRGGFSGGVFLGGGLNVGRLPASTNRRFIRDCLGDGNRFDRDGGGGAATPRGRSRRGLLFSPGALFPLPPGTDASDLVVGEHAHVATDRNVHEPKKGDHFFGGDSEFVCQLTD
jgi:hypothetical protein